MDRFRTVEISRLQFYQFCRFTKMQLLLSLLLDKSSRSFFFKMKKNKVLYKMVLVSDVLDHIGPIYSHLNLANIKIKNLILSEILHRITKGSEG